MHYIGLMSGTSVDGIDAVVVEIKADNAFSLVASHGEPIPADVTARIHQLMGFERDHLDAYGALDVELGQLFAKAATAVLHKAGLSRKTILAIGSHGQTVRHRPAGSFPFSLQIANPSVIAELTGITTIADFRMRDIAAGGQGAPLVPAFHHWLFHSTKRGRVIINIGGIANITLLPKNGPVIGFDTGPGNTLLDRWAQRHINQHYDVNGQWADSGKVSDLLLQQLLEDSYFHAPSPKSTGQEHFSIQWLENALGKLGTTIDATDVQATLVEFTAQSIALELGKLKAGVDEAYVCGGGSQNKVLMRQLTNKLAAIDLPLKTTDTLGLPADWVEASAFAWLAHQTLQGLPGNIPTVTGAKQAVILGGIFPGGK